MVSVSDYDTQHLPAFCVNYWLTFSLAIRVAKCFEDCYERYRRMRYFLQLCPWATMKGQHFLPTDGLLPTFELTSITNIEAWNKMRIYLERYDLKSTQRRQLSVVVLLLSWIAVAVYQLFKFFNPEESSVDTESVMQMSNTLQVVIGMSAILYFGNRTNELQGLGFEHMLRVQQGELVSKSSHFLVEHERWHSRVQGSTPKSDKVGQRLDDGQKKFMELIEADRNQDDAGRYSVKSMEQMQEWLRQNSNSWSNDPAPFERSREFYLLESLIETVKNEHGTGDRAHWGAEDRRARLLFIHMDRQKLLGFWTSVISGFMPVLYNYVTTRYNPIQERDIQNEVGQWNATLTGDGLLARIAVAILEAIEEPGAIS